MRTILSLLLLVSIHGAVLAQPGAPAPDPYPPPPPAQQPPAPYPPPPDQPYPQQPPPPPTGMSPYPQYIPVQLTADEQALLAQGEISDGAHIGGAVASLFFGFGIGQAVQGRYGETGWIFTLGEAASITAVVVGVVQAFDDCFEIDGESCNNDNGGEALIVAGLIGIVVFRVWEVVDAFGGPGKHNAKVRQLKMRLGMPMPMYSKITPYVNKSRDGGGVAGLSFRF